MKNENFLENMISMFSFSVNILFLIITYIIIDLSINSEDHRAVIIVLLDTSVKNTKELVQYLTFFIYQNHIVSLFSNFH